MNILLLRNLFIFTLFFLGQPSFSQSNNDAIDGLIKLALEQREAARLRKDFATADQIRDEIAALGITVEDTANGPRWSY